MPDRFTLLACDLFKPLLEAAMSDSLAVLPQYLLPKKALTMLAGTLAGARAGGATTAMIRWFVKRYNVNMAEAANPDIASYPTFNEFFTRPLRDDARPLADSPYLCPVDGAISQFGRIEADQIFQAKGHHYSTTALVGGDAALAAQFADGEFATLYLSPRDYHRIHMPCDGELRRIMTCLAQGLMVDGDFFGHLIDRLPQQMREHVRAELTCLAPSVWIASGGNPYLQLFGNRARLSFDCK